MSVAIQPAGSGWSDQEFGGLVEPFRRELLAHSYRMLGSFDDAEDAVQDGLARAWQSRTTYVRAISFRAWLYRIVTNACLDAIARRKRAGQVGSNPVTPVPDELLASLRSPVEASPEARIDARESVSLAFLAALQLLPPRQRAVLLLRDVLALRATEVATLLDLSVPAVTSALQRARATLRSASASRSASNVASPVVARLDDTANPPPAIRSLLDRYVRAWEAADIAGLVRLLRDDAILAMPPPPSVAGAEAIGRFLADRIFAGFSRRRLVAVPANGQPAFVAYAAIGTANP